MIRSALNEGMKKSDFLPKEPTTFKICENETWATADYEYVKIFYFAMLDKKLSLKEENSWHEFRTFKSMNLNEYNK